MTAPPPTAAPTTTIRRTTTTVRTAPTAVSPTEPPTTATTVITSTTNLLVPGDGSDGSQSTTTTIAVASTSGISESTRVTAIVAGLVVIALMVAIMTARYWRMTKPVPLADNAALDVLETEDDTGDDLDEPVEPATTSGPTADGGATRVRTRPGHRRHVAGATIAPERRGRLRTGTQRLRRSEMSRSAGPRYVGN